MEIAVFGGTFDPPTLAHKAIIKACLERKDIDEVWLMPSGYRTDKPGMLTDVHRINMLELLCSRRFKDARVKITDFELRLPQPTQTHKTVAAIEDEHLGNSFWYVFGADSYHAMESWEQGNVLKQKMGMLIVERGGYSLPAEKRNIKHLRVDKPKEKISSTKVRQRSREGRTIRGMVSPAVEMYIATQRLYGHATIDG